MGSGLRSREVRSPLQHNINTDDRLYKTPQDIIPHQRPSNQFSLNTPSAYNMRFPIIAAIMSLLVMAGLTVAVSRHRPATSTMIY